MVGSSPEGSDSAILSPQIILESFKKAGVSHIVTVPDYVQLSLHEALRESAAFADRIVLCCTEDEAVCVGAGLYAGGATPILIMQNQGIYAAANSLRAVGLDARVPILIMVGQFGREAANYGRPFGESARPLVSRLLPLLDVLAINHMTLETNRDVTQLADFLTTSFDGHRPTAIVVGVHTAWPES